MRRADRRLRARQLGVRVLSRWRLPDATLCNGAERCEDFACVQGEAVTCPTTSPTGNVCVVPTCVAATGECKDAPRAGAPSCDDGQACTSGDHCVDGVCEGSARLCDDELACSSDSCSEAAGGCTADVTGCECQDDGDCDDHNLCDGVEHCVDGHCAESSPVVCVAPTEPCMERVCQPASGSCKLQARAVSVACDDDDACTLGDHCGAGGAAGTCVSDSAVECMAVDDCHDAGICNPLSGECTTTALTGGELCESAAGWNGETGRPGTCHGGVCIRLPVLAAGAEHACALFADGGMRCWGKGSTAALGYGNYHDVGISEVFSVRGAGIVASPPMAWIAAGDGMTCGGSADGTRCWGSSDNCLGYQSCGSGATLTLGGTPETVPAKLSTLDLGESARARQLAADGVHACFVTETATVRCWGAYYSQDTFGVGYVGEPYIGVYGGPNMGDVLDIQLSPPAEGFSATKVAISLEATCVLSQAGSLRCWGHKEVLGLGDNISVFIGDDEAPSAVPPTWDDTTDRAIDICVGSETPYNKFGNAYLVTEHGSLYAWGDSAEYLGTGGASARTRPNLITTGLVAAQVVCNKSHVCLLGANGEVRCWGMNSHGELGIGSRQQWGQSAQFPVSDVPKVQLSSPAVQVVAGKEFNCAVLRNAEIVCWGANTHGQLGTDSTEDFGDEPDELVPAMVRFE
ncbi:MAG: hypothetical protein U1F43_22510 [Myxococcota bacterium]